MWSVGLNLAATRNDDGPITVQRQIMTIMLVHITHPLRSLGIQIKEFKYFKCQTDYCNGGTEIIFLQHILSARQKAMLGQLPLAFVSDAKSLL